MMMKLTVSVVVLLAFVALSSSSDPDQVCEPGSSKMDDCNRCHCAADGKAWACTRMMCIPNLPKKVPVNSPGFTCEPNKIFMDDCNTCSCDESGSLARCTAMACDPNERHKRSVSDEVAESHKKNLPVTPGNQCVPGTTWKEDCNTCFCSDSGYAGCTLMGCFSLDDPKFANLNLAGDKN